MESKLQEN